jgi:hypothetical protein
MVRGLVQWQVGEPDECIVIGNRDDQQTAWLQRRDAIAEERQRIGDVLEHLECRDDIVGSGPIFSVIADERFDIAHSTLTRKVRQRIY